MRPWLLANVNKAAGKGTEKAAGYGLLFNHFFMVFQPEATILLHRLSALKSGDALSERFPRWAFPTAKARSS